MKKRGRGGRYDQSLLSMQKQHPGIGVEWLPRVVRSSKGDRSLTRGENTSVVVHGRRSGRQVWPTLGEGDVMKERHYTPWKRYARVHAEGVEEPRMRKRPVGRKMAMATLGRPMKWTDRASLEGLGVQQDHRSAWDRRDRQRRFRHRRQRGKPRTEYHRRKRRRRQCERARNLYEYSTRRRVEPEVLQERTHKRRGYKEGVMASQGIRDWSRQKGLGIERGAVLEGVEKGLGVQGTDIGFKGVVRSVVPSSGMPGRQGQGYGHTQSSGRIFLWGDRKLVWWVQGEARHHGYGVDAQTSLARYQREVSQLFGRSELISEGVGLGGRHSWLESGPVQNRRGRGCSTLLGGLGERNVRCPRDGVYSLLGEGYGERMYGESHSAGMAVEASGLRWPGEDEQVYAGIGDGRGLSLSWKAQRRLMLRGARRVWHQEYQVRWQASMSWTPWMASVGGGTRVQKGSSKVLERKRQRMRKIQLCLGLQY